MKGYDYENQEHVRPMYRKSVFPTEEEFWKSGEEVLFRVNCTEYAEFRKFREWFMKEITDRKEKGGSYQQDAFKKYGMVDGLDCYEKDYSNVKGFDEFAVYKYDQTFYGEKKVKFDLWDTPVKVKTGFGNEHRIEAKVVNNNKD